MITDQMKISIRLNSEEKTQVYNALNEKGHKSPSNKEKENRKKYYYNDAQHNFIIELVLPYRDLYVIFNPHKIYKNTVNIGMLTEKQLIDNVKFIQSAVESVLEMALPHFSIWKNETIEINKDTIHKSFGEIKAIIDGIRLNDAGHLKRSDNGGLWDSWQEKGMKIKCYYKKAEVLTHYPDGYELPKGCSEADLNMTTRLEITLHHRKLKHIINRLLGTNKKIIKLKDILNPYILIAIYNSVMEKFNLAFPMKSLETNVKTINNKVKRKDTKKKLIEFMTIVKKFGVTVAKTKYKSSFYRYKNKLSKIGVNIISLEGSFKFNALLNYRSFNIKTLKRFVEFFNIRLNFSIVYNMYVLFRMFKNFTIPFRI